MKPLAWLFTVGVMLLNIAVSTTLAQDQIINITAQSIQSRFRDSITAEISAKHRVEISNVEFYYRVVGRIAISRNVAEFEPGLQVEAQFSLNQRRIYLPPGTELEYWWRLTDVEGYSLKTEPQFYTYLDDRFEFKTLGNDRVTLYWYNGSQAFGQALFRQATKALDRLETDIGASVERPIKIFIYGSHQDLLNTLSIGSREWTGGVAFTDQAVIVIGIEPENLDWGLYAMTHEITHQVVHQVVQNPYTDLPTWLSEGVAVYNESPDALHDRYQEIVGQAAESDSLFTLRSLSSSFPADSEEASLAYGQSGDVFHFMMQTYGPEAMTRFFNLFGEGVLVDRALQEALGVTTWEIDNAYRENLGLPALPELVDTLSQAETAPTAESNSTPAETEPASATQPDSEEAPPRLNESTEETVSTNEVPAKSSRRLQCLGGLLPLMFLGLVITQQRRSTYRRYQV